MMKYRIELQRFVEQRASVEIEAPAMEAALDLARLHGGHIAEWQATGLAIYGRVATIDGNAAMHGESLDGGVVWDRDNPVGETVIRIVPMADDGEGGANAVDADAAQYWDVVLVRYLGGGEIELVEEHTLSSHEGARHQAHRIGANYPAATVEDMGV